MLKNSLKMCLLLVVGAVLFGCTDKPLPPFQASDLNSKVNTRGYVQKVDNFIVVFDASSSMGRYYMEHIKVNLAKGVVSRMNRTIPDIRLVGGLRVFGPAYFRGGTALYYGMTDYSQSGFEEGLDMVNMATGYSPLSNSISTASDDLKTTQGKIAVIVVSDGMDQDDTPVAAARSMKSRYGDRVCIYPILIGDDRHGMEIMDQISKAGDCGFAVNGDDILSANNMADYVTRVFFGKRTGDLPMMHAPAPSDRDGDGVTDNRDKCPGTPKAARVNSVGCWILKRVLFGTDLTGINSKYHPFLNDLARVLNANPSFELVIDGHTDNQATKGYNQKLSKDRAEAVKAYLVKRGVASGRMKTVGFWFTKPAESNDTAEGRIQNRRVEFRIKH